MDAYQLLLDMYPLLDTFPEQESRNLVERIRKIVTDMVLEPEDNGKAQELQLLLSLSYDLGYLAEDVYAFLTQQLDI